MLLQMVDSSPFVMKMYDNVLYEYPLGARVIGWALALSSVLMIPIVAIRALASSPGSCVQVSNSYRGIQYN